MPSSTKPRERGILFNSAMVKAILDGRKTVTRRPIQPQPTDYHDCSIQWGGKVIAQRGPDGRMRFFGGRTPFGVPGDLLYVRETWGGEPFDVDEDGLGTYSLRYRADFPDGARIVGEPWKPSIHMPKWAARIWLRVTDVRVERVQEITVAQVEAEGTRPLRDHRAHWAERWDAIYEARGLGWEANPWAWACEFERIDKPAGQGGQDA